MVDIPYRRELEFSYGSVAQLAPGIRRVIANNPSPFTFHGTGTYILGSGQVAVIDPGPNDGDHIDAILDALADEEERRFCNGCIRGAEELRLFLIDVAQKESKRAYDDAIHRLQNAPHASAAAGAPPRALEPGWLTNAYPRCVHVGLSLIHI